MRGKVWRQGGWSGVEKRGVAVDKGKGGDEGFADTRATGTVRRTMSGWMRGRGGRMIGSITPSPSYGRVQLGWPRRMPPHDVDPNCTRPVQACWFDSAVSGLCSSALFGVAVACTPSPSLSPSPLHPCSPPLQTYTLSVQPHSNTHMYTLDPSVSTYRVAWCLSVTISGSSIKWLKISGYARSR